MSRGYLSYTTPRDTILLVSKVELEADHPAYDAAIVTLKMPDGVKVRIRAFFRDDEAMAWVDHVRKLIAAAPEHSFRQTPYL